MIYGYTRISRKEQSIDRQIRNIKSEYPTAIILKEAYTGTKMNRPEWTKLRLLKMICELLPPIETGASCFNHYCIGYDVT